MRGRSKAGAVGLTAGVIGALLMLTGVGFQWEEDFSLWWLFRLRGALEPPPEVAIVSIDRHSARHIGVGRQPRDWPRSLHGELIDRLVELGASVIVFDVFFEAAGVAAEDARLVEGVERARRVVLFQRLDHDELLPEVSSSRLLDPFPALARAARGLAPFPLPKIPNRVNQFWAFYPAFGEVVPTLPTVALQLYVLETVDHAVLTELLTRAGAAVEWPAQVERAETLQHLAESLHAAFRQDRRLVARFLAEVAALQLPAAQQQTLAALAQVFAGADSYFVNYYGEPATLPVIRYSTVLRAQALVDLQDKPVDLRDKVVFVGSLDLSPQQEDEFYTVFSTEDGKYLSGVEIAATAFANLLSQRPLWFPGRFVTLGLVLLFGGAAGLLAVWLPGLRALAVTVAGSVLYFGLAQTLFALHDLWLPLFVPLVIQLPAALTLGWLYQYWQARRARDSVKQAMGYYLPEPALEQLIERGGPTLDSELVYSACLVTDVQDYTTLSERLAPQELAALNNEYFSALGAQVALRQGILLEIIGDGMTVVWPARRPERAMRLCACLAALDILQAVEVFNRRHPDKKFITRTGLHAGPVALGNISSGKNYMYTVTGDTVNTASRIEGLNKVLKTRLLAAEAVVEGLDELLLRRVGLYQFKGKTAVLPVFEIRSLQAQATPHERDLCERFNAAMAAFVAQDWQAARQLFETLQRQYEKDEPTRYFLELSRRYCVKSPAPRDGPVIRLTVK